MSALQRRKRQAEQRRAAMVVHKPKAPPLVRMEELRALNMIQLDPDDAKARIEQAQKPKGIIPSGGFTNFRCSPLHSQSSTSQRAGMVNIAV